jgi:hypothetical protein
MFIEITGIDGRLFRKVGRDEKQWPEGKGTLRRMESVLALK